MNTNKIAYVLFFLSLLITYTNAASQLSLINYTGPGYYHLNGRYQYISSSNYTTYQSASSGLTTVTLTETPSAAATYWSVCATWMGPKTNQINESGSTCIEPYVSSNDVIIRPPASATKTVTAPMGAVIYYVCAIPATTITINGVSTNGQTGGYSFSGWSGSYNSAASCQDLQPPFLNVTGPTTLQANFLYNSSITTYKFNELASPSVGGEVGPGPGSYSAGTPITISATPNSGYTFKNWTCTGTGCYSGPSATTTFTLSSSVTEQANFVSSNSQTTNGGCTITATESPFYGGSASSYHPNGTTCGSTLIISELNNSGYAFKNWTCTGTGCYSGTSSTATFTLSSSITEQANFVLASTVGNTCASNIVANPYGGGTVSSAGGAACGSTLSIYAVPNPGYVFTSWTCTGKGCYSGTSSTATFTLSSYATEQANFQPSSTLPSYQLTESASPSIGGRIAYSPATQMTLAYPAETQVTLIEAPNASYAFKNWTCTGTGCYSGPSIYPTITLSSPTTEQANFEPSSATLLYQLTEFAGPSTVATVSSISTEGTAHPGSGLTVSPGTGYYPPGTRITISATPDFGYTFTSWSGTGTGSYTGTAASPTITMNGNIVEDANYVLIPGNTTLTLRALAMLHGSPTTAALSNFSNDPLTYWQICAAWKMPGEIYDAGSTCLGPIVSPNGTIISQTASIGTVIVPLGAIIDSICAEPVTTAKANGGYSFIGWGGSGASYDSEANCWNFPSPSVNITGPTTLQANFLYNSSVATYKFIGLANPPAGGTLYGSGIYSNGTQITFSETPVAGYFFTGWTCTGTNCYSGTSPNATITLRSSTTETANFQLSSPPSSYPFAESASPPAGGTVSPGSGSYAPGTQITISEHNNTCYAFTSWTGVGAGSYTGKSKSTTITINGTTTETANYYAIATSACSNYSIYNTLIDNLLESASPPAGGTVSPGTGSYPPETKITISATPNSGYTFKNWTCTGSSCYSGTDTVANFVITSNTVETANFQSVVPSYNNFIWMIDGALPLLLNVNSSYPTKYLDTKISYVIGTSMPSGWITKRSLYYPNYYTLQNALQNNAASTSLNLVGTNAVLYDDEDWNFTPQAQQLNPGYYTQLAENVAHSKGLLLIATPGIDLATAEGYKGNKFTGFVALNIAGQVAPYADIYEIQSQNTENNVSQFSSFVSQVSAQVRAANPNAIILAGISTNGAPNGPTTAATLLKDINSTRNSVAGYWLNIANSSAYCPNCGTAQPQVAVQLFQYFSAAGPATLTFTESASPSAGGSVSPGSGNYLYGSAVTIIATPNPGYAFTGWTCTGSGCYSGTSPTATFNLSSSVTEQANFVQTPTVANLCTLNVFANPSNGGTPSINGQKFAITCGSAGPSGGAACTSASPSTRATPPTNSPGSETGCGSPVSFSETPNSGYTFTGWTCTGKGCYSGTNASATVTYNGVINETANYKSTTASTVSLITSVSPYNGGGVSPRSGAYDYGANVAISETPSAGYTFTDWVGIGTGSYTGTNSTAHITINNPIIETANFRRTSSTRTNNANTIVQPNYPTPTNSSVSQQKISNMMNVLRAFLKSLLGSKNGSSFTTGQANSTSSNSPNTSGTCTVNLNANPSNGGTVSSTGGATCGSSISISEAPKAGYTFTDWTCSGSASSSCPTGTQTSFSFTVTGSATVTADFTTFIANTAAANYTLTESASPSAGGKIFPGSRSYAPNSTAMISEQPNLGYAFVNWTCTGKGCYSGTKTDAIVPMLSNVIETAHYKPVTYWVTANAVPPNGGTVSPASEANVNFMANVTLTATPAPNYAFMGWEKCYADPSNPNCLFSSPFLTRVNPNGTILLINYTNPYAGSSGNPTNTSSTTRVTVYENTTETAYFYCKSTVTGVLKISSLPFSGKIDYIMYGGGGGAGGATGLNPIIYAGDSGHVVTGSFTATAGSPLTVYVGGGGGGAMDYLGTSGGGGGGAGYYGGGGGQGGEGSYGGSGGGGGSSAILYNNALIAAADGGNGGGIGAGNPGSGNGGGMGGTGTAGGTGGGNKTETSDHEPLYWLGGNGGAFAGGGGGGGGEGGVLIEGWTYANSTIIGIVNGQVRYANGTQIIPSNDPYEAANGTNGNNGIGGTGGKGVTSSTPSNSNLGYGGNGGSGISGGAGGASGIELIYNSEDSLISILAGGGGGGGGFGGTGGAAAYYDGEYPSSASSIPSGATGGSGTGGLGGGGSQGTPSPALAGGQGGSIVFIWPPSESGGTCTGTNYP